jgi:hypothetical protein
MVQLTDDLIDRLDRTARRRLVSRSALIREFVELGLREEREAEIGRRIAAGYERVPQVIPDEWGDPAALADRSTAETMQRLEAEERAAGHSPW